jgi:hypothetical protein
VRLRWVLIALIALVAIGGAFSASNPATTGHSGGASDCSSKQRVTLVIDFGDERTPLTRCAAGFEGTGWQLFSATATKVAGTDQYPEGFVCRVEGWPTAEVQGCHSTPNYAQGGWAYFYKSTATLGKWVFSPTGSALRHPVCGSIEGWRFFGPNQNPADGPPRSDLNPHAC